MPGAGVSGRSATGFPCGDMPDRHHVTVDLIPAGPPPPQARRPVRERPGRAGITGQPVDGVQHRTETGGITTRTGILSRRGVVITTGSGSMQLVTVRHVGAFLGDPLDVPLVVLDYVAAQLGVADPSCVKRYTERDKTRLEHQREIAEVDGCSSFASAEAGLVQ